MYQSLPTEIDRHGCILLVGHEEMHDEFGSYDIDLRPILGDDIARASTNTIFGGPPEAEGLVHHRNAAEITLIPRMSHVCISLSGTIDGDEVRGEWIKRDFAPTISGTFLMRRKGRRAALRERLSVASKLVPAKSRGAHGGERLDAITRKLFIVAADNVADYRSLERAVGGEPYVTVIYDRRHHSMGAPEQERRRRTDVDEQGLGGCPTQRPRGPQGWSRGSPGNRPLDVALD